MSLLSTITGAPVDVVEIHAAAPDTAPLNRRARQWAEATMAIYDEADTLFFGWQQQARRAWIMERLMTFAESMEDETNRTT